MSDRHTLAIDSRSGMSEGVTLYHDTNEHKQVNNGDPT